MGVHVCPASDEDINALDWNYRLSNDVTEKRNTDESKHTHTHVEAPAIERCMHMALIRTQQS